MTDVIIALGCNFLKPENIKQIEARTKKAVELYQQGKAKKIIFSGGFYSRKDLSEAKYMSDLAIKSGIPARDIILEEKSIETIENAKFSTSIMDKYGFNSAVVVTSPWHIKRTKFIFEKTMPNKTFEFIGSDEKSNFFKKLIYYWKEFWALRKVKKITPA